MTAALPVPLPLDPAPKATLTLRERARAAFAAGELSQARAAIEIGISDSALSQWLSRKYSGSDDAVSAAVQRWIETRVARARLTESLPADPEWFSTPSAEIIMAGLSYAQMAGDICLVYGSPGVGKTRAARHYATQYANVWVAQMFPTCTLWSCLDRTARAVGLRASHARSSRIEADLIERLNGSRGLLVIDEAHLLGARALEELRSLHDATGTGLALVGNPLLFSRLTGHRAEQFEQLYSRIGKIVRLPRTTVADADALLAAWGIAGPGVRDTAHDIVRRKGGLRRLTRVLRWATLSARGADVTASHLAAAWKDLGGPIGPPETE